MGPSTSMLRSRRLTAHLLAAKSGYCASLRSRRRDPDAWADQAVCNYLSGLLLELTGRTGDELVQTAAELRRSSLHAISWARKRPATAEDILDALQKVVDVPEDLTELIRDDVGATLTPG